MIVCLPLAVFVIMLIIQAGAFYHAQQVAKMAADRAVAVARTENGTAGFGQDQADRVLHTVGDGSLTDARVTVTRASGQVTVTIKADAPHFMPLWPSRVTVASTGPVEAFDDGGRHD
jgi:Flp pilus assembly protein TadG